MKAIYDKKFDPAFFKRLQEGKSAHFLIMNKTKSAAVKASSDALDLTNEELEENPQTDLE